MSKFQEAIQTYNTFMTDKLGLINVNQDILNGLADMLGEDVINHPDASLVACSDKAERSRVKQYFLLDALKLEDTPALDEAIEAVCKLMGSANRKKYRVVFYYLLLQRFGLESQFTKTETIEVVSTKAIKAKTEKTETATAAPTATEPTATATSTSKASKAPAKTTAAAMTLDEAYELYRSYLTDELGETGFNEGLLYSITQSLGSANFDSDAALVAASDAGELQRIRQNFLIGKLGLPDNGLLNYGINTVAERMGKSNRRKYRAVFYYLLTTGFEQESVYLEPATAVLY